MFATSSFGAPAPSFNLSNDPRSERLFHEHRKLAACARSFVQSRPDLASLGDDPVLSQMLASNGFGAHDAVVGRVAFDGKVVTAIVVPTRIWRDSDARARLRDIKTQAASMRTAVILVPQRWIRAEVRNSVARLIAQSRNTRVEQKQLRAILTFLRQERITTLSEAASVIRDHHDPFGALLGLAAKGLIDIDRSRKLGADSFVFTRL